MTDLDRRQALAALAAVATVHWAGGASAAPGVEAPIRVRAGAPVDLRHPDATHFRLETPGRPPVLLEAPTGRLRVRAPLADADGFAPLTCTPLRRGRPVAAAAEVAVLQQKLLFGA